MFEVSARMIDSSICISRGISGRVCKLRTDFFKYYLNTRTWHALKAKTNLTEEVKTCGPHSH
jgi:hypothetical protein